MYRTFIALAIAFASSLSAFPSLAKDPGTASQGTKATDNQTDSRGHNQRREGRDQTRVESDHAIDIRPEHIGGDDMSGQSGSKQSRSHK